MKGKKIGFFDAKKYDIDFFNEANRKFNFEIKYFPGHLNADSADIASGYEGICAFVNDEIDAKVIKKLVKNGVKAIALRSAGYNNVDLKSAYGRIHVMRVPAYSPDSVAEYAVSLMLTLNRKIHKAYNRVREGNFSISGLLGFDMTGKTAGVIGTGKIGKALIKILKGFGMDIIAYDKFPDRKFAAKTGIKYVTLDRIFRKSDILTLHCPLNKDTFHIINAVSLKKMKKGVMLINTGRGGLVDTRALIVGLKSGNIGSAGLDVYEEEDEYFFEDFSDKTISDDILARLLTFNNVIVTSHQGFFTEEALSSIADVTLNNFEDYFRGKKLINEICYKCGEKECKKEKEGVCF